LRILDKYILKKYFTSFIFTLLILTPIAIAIDVADKIGKFLADPGLKVSTIIFDYYFNFIINYGNTFMPLALFIAVIFFTSKMANNTEIIAYHTAGISFKRFLRPYFIGATLVTLFALFMTHLIVPHSNKVLDEFHNKYVKKHKFSNIYVRNVSLQLDKNDYIYIKTYNIKRNIGYSFSFEHYNGNQLKYKILADNIRWNKKDSTYTLSNYKKRKILATNDIIKTGVKMDTVFNFKPKDLLYIDTYAREMNSFKLSKFIKNAKKRGVKNLNRYIVDLYGRTSLPVSSFILTLIAVILGSKKRRGGMGLNLAFGFSLMFIYVFFMKISAVLGSVATSNSLLMVWLPNIIFGILALFLYKNAER